MARIAVGNPDHHDASRWVEKVARVGFVAKGLLYATVGVLASCAGLGRGGTTTDSRGAMERLVTMPFGEVLLACMAFGLVGYAIWRIVEGIVDPDDRGRDAKGIALRASFVARGLIHLGLAWSAAMLASRMPRSFSFGSGPGSSGGSDQQTQSMTATAISLPMGRWLVLAVAIGIASFGAWQVVRAFRAKLSRNVDKADAEREVGAWVIAVSRFGIGARGLVFVVLGWLLALAAWRSDPGQAGGVERGLQVFAELGWWPLVAIGAGLVAYGVYQLLSAKYRRIRV